jgi:hypothetical protein
MKMTFVNDDEPTLALYEPGDDEPTRLHAKATLEQFFARPASPSLPPATNTLALMTALSMPPRIRGAAEDPDSTVVDAQPPCAATPTSSGVMPLLKLIESTLVPPTSQGRATLEIDLALMGAPVSPGALNDSDLRVSLDLVPHPSIPSIPRTRDLSARGVRLAVHAVMFLRAIAFFVISATSAGLRWLLERSGAEWARAAERARSSGRPTD